MENKINPLSVDERLNLQREIKEAEQDKTTVEADADLKKCSKDTLDVSVIRKKRLLEIDAAQKLEAIKDRDKISKLINELESEIVDNMPTLKEQDVRPKNSADFERAVRKTEAWVKKQPLIDRWKYLKRLQEPDNPAASDINELRRRKSKFYA